MAQNYGRNRDGEAICIVASKQEGFWPFCAPFIPESKNMHVRLIADSELSLGVSVYVFCLRVALCGTGNLSSMFPASCLASPSPHHPAYPSLNCNEAAIENGYIYCSY